ncbi:hypothetical protein BDV93DRAFT_602780 [Ceratobasidium sp. AG-I]|nr:hypothetical protein BDV93DRAFT_602780 [Ceratobasidium sp. AG-I]
MPRAKRSKSKPSPSLAASSSSTPFESMLINPSSDDTIYFYKPQQEYGYLSQWHASTFTLTEPDGSTTYTYENAEQFMMHRKGVLFAPDSHITSAILETTNPRDIKALGRKVPNFDDAVWKRERMNIVTQGTYLKFTQDK